MGRRPIIPGPVLREEPPAPSNDKKSRRRVPPPSEPSPFFSAKELAARWRCSRTSVDRIAERAGLTRVLLGTGRTGMVRFKREEVIAYEESRSIGRG